MASNLNSIISVALPVPLRRVFDYLSQKNTLPAIGARVKVPFGHQEMIGIVVAHPDHTDVPFDKLKPLTEIIDQSPLLPETIWLLIQKAALYYHHGIGDALSTALPNALMKGQPCELKKQCFWSITEQGRVGITQLRAQAVRQQKALRYFCHPDSPDRIEQSLLIQQEISRATLNALKKKNWLICHWETADRKTPASSVAAKTSIQLNPQQQRAVDAIISKINHFSPFLLEGITGSGKTEVYLQTIAKIISDGLQALVLIPEIGLTPQTLKRFESRFPARVGIWHSGMTDQQRLDTWLKARAGLIDVVIGTRSALFVPLQKPGLIVVDEEHDLSFKQQDGFRYSSRDLALVRAQLERIPVILGSATASLESLKNASDNRYHHLRLTRRAGGSELPKIRLIDCKDQPMQEGFSSPLLSLIERHLIAGNQVMVFINRRGFAPVLLCHRCGWIADCRRCDCSMTLHQSGERSYLQCHHCGDYQSLPKHCHQCECQELLSIGQGTERIEAFLAQQFSDYSLQRIDRDTTRRKHAMSEYVAAAKSGQTRILVGTQMIAKGHHFPKVSLVAILDMDGALFSVDFRAAERAAQLVTQVSGRAGRADIRGEVAIQTHHPEHPLFARLIENNYSDLARHLLQERSHALLPPFTFMALFRAETHDKTKAQQFLHMVREKLQTTQHRLEIIGPVASTLSRKSGRFRFQLLINASSRTELHSILDRQLPNIEADPLSTKVRWSLDIDPQDLL